jgi:hypothetical protein
MKIQRKRRRELQPSSHTLYTVERRERPRSPGMAMHGYGSCHGVLLSGTPAPAWALTSRYGRHCSLARWPSYLDSPNDPTGYRLGLVYGYGLMGRRCSHCRTLARTYVHGRFGSGVWRTGERRKKTQYAADVYRTENLKNWGRAV